MAYLVQNFKILALAVPEIWRNIQKRENQRYSTQNTALKPGLVVWHIVWKWISPTSILQLH